MMPLRPGRSIAVNLATGTATRYVLLAVNIGIGIWMMPFSVGHLGKSDYGLWMLVVSMTAYFQLFDLGYGNGLVRQITDADARGDERAINELVSTFAVVYAAIGAVALLATAALAAWVVPRFPNLSAGQVTTAQWVTVVLGIRIAVGFPMTVFGAVTTSRQYFALSSSIAIAVSLLAALVTYLVLEAGYGLRVLVPATTAVNLLAYVAYARAAWFAYPGLRLAPSLFSPRHLREVTSYSLYLFLITVAAHLGYNLDNVVVGAFMGTSAVAVYAVASRLADYQRQLSNQFNGLLFPVVVGLGAQNDRARLRATMLHGTRLALGLALAVTIGLLAFAPPLVRAWMGPTFEDSLAPLYALAIASVVLVALGPLGNILLGTGRHRLVAFSSLAEALLNVGLSLLLVRRWGLAGVAAGTAIPVVAMNLLVLLPAACRSLDVRPGRFVREAAAPALLPAVPALAIAVVLRLYVPPASLLAVAAAGALVGLVYLAGFVSFGLPAGDRRQYVSYIRRAAGSTRQPVAAVESGG
ncbi:MAG TPA: oligosaccharide flippase family protein [Vicinamibacterales bacterium]|nr:oligosaccharide flippase family protein [Vicinamibacterales bacterium]HQL31528.1 oligosaccharide flippase family protein [Thermoanaerobaculales bacterium]